MKHSIFSKIIMIYRNMRLREKIFISYTLLIFISLSFLGYYSYDQNYKIAKEQILSSISGDIQQSDNSLQNLFFGIERQANLFASNHTVQEILSNSNAGDIKLEYDDFVNMDKTINIFEKNNDIYAIRLYLKEYRVFFHDGARYFYENSDGTDKGSSMLYEYNSKITWNDVHEYNYGLKGDEQVISCAKTITSDKDISKYLAKVYFDISEKTIRDCITNINSIEMKNVYVIDQRGYVVTSLNGDFTGQKHFNENFMSKIASQSSGILNEKVFGKNSLIIYRAINNRPFYIVVDVLMNEISQRSSVILKKFLFILIIILILSFIIAYVISYSITKGIKQLIEAMNNIETNKFNAKIPVYYNDEISILKRDFNWMTDRIRDLIEDVYNSNLEKKKAELNLLQAQINPHFLYNTLDSINWLALRLHADEISYIVKNLSDFLRAGLNNGNQITTIENEIRHVQAYFNIQKYRFEDRVNLNVNVPYELYEYKTISLILQPLVENAIIHGILEEEGRKGTVVIDADKVDNFITIEVKDNGKGMDNETLERVLNNIKDTEYESKGYGLRNVHQRIRYRFGDEFGLNIISKENIGTSFIIIFPAIEG